MIQFQIVIKPVLNRRPCGELRLRPDPKNSRRKDVRAGVTQPFEIGHLLSCFWRFSVVCHGMKGWEITRSIRG